MRQIGLCCLPMMLLLAACAAEAGYVRHSELNHERQNAVFATSHFLEDGRHAWISAVKAPYDPGTVVIFRTTNGGDSWQRIDTTLTGDPMRMQFVDSRNGWLVTNQPQSVMRTRDGGATWARDSLDGDWVTHGIRDFKMLSATEGYGAGQSGPRGCFFHYDGTTWRPLPGPDIRCSLHSMDVQDSRHMWALGGDGVARAWGRLGSEQVVPLDPGILPCGGEIHFHDRNRGWIGSAGIMLHTSDGGRTWREQDAWTVHGITAIHFVSPLEGRAGTTYGELLSTSDGGATWTNERIMPGAIKEITRWQDRWHITAVGGLFTFEEPRFHLGRVTEAMPLPTTPRPAPNPDERTWRPMSSLDAARGNATINCAAFHGDSHIWLGAQDRGLAMVLFTQDAGSTWRRVPLPLPSPTIHDIAFVNERVGWLACTGNPAVWHTTDGGHTWTGQSYAGGWADNGRVTDLNMLDPTMGYAVYIAPGARTQLLYWTSGTGMWSERETPINDSFYRLWFQDTNNCWLVMNAATGWRGTGGWNFSPMRMGAPGAVECLFNLDGTWGWMGSDGLILRTTDGGASWQDQTVPLPRGSLVNGIYFRDRRHGCAVASRGQILLTEDGGATWRQTAPLDQTLSSLKSVAWFDGSWTVAGAYGVFREGPRIATLMRLPDLTGRIGGGAAAAPGLRYYGDELWIDRGSGRAHPERGHTDFFRVTYSDPGGEEPQEVVLVITDPTGATERRNMYPLMGNLTTGKAYERFYGWAHSGTYRYRFEATSAAGIAATGPATETIAIEVTER